MGYVATGVTVSGVAEVSPAFKWSAVKVDNFETIAGTWARATGATMWSGVKVHNETGAAVNDQISLGTLFIPLDGNYTVYMVHMRDSDHGKAHILLNGVDKGSVDCYGASAVSVASNASLAALVKGHYDISVKVSDKNASSSSYRLFLQSLVIVKTG